LEELFHGGEGLDLLWRSNASILEGFEGFSHSSSWNNGIGYIQIELHKKTGRDSRRVP